MSILGKFWRIWAKALGEKAGKNDKEADYVALLRTFIFFTYLITNIAIVANAIRHWNDLDKTAPVSYNKHIDQQHRDSGRFSTL